MNINVKLTRQENADLFGVFLNDTVSVDLEEYVAAVVASEIGNSALSACKAQAVAARTFAANKGALDGKTITDSSSTDQAYRAGRCDSGLYPHAVQAARETAGEILVYNERPISAVYSACNGGRTVSSQERWGSVRPYLIAQDDPWDNSTTRTGHGVGMSQRGAKAMAAAGKSYREILAFYYPGTEVSQINSEVGDHMVTAKQFIEQVLIPLHEGWGYIYGTWGTLWTKDQQDRATREQTVRYGSKWIGKKVTDCSGLIRRALFNLGEKIVHHATYQYTDWCNAKGKLVNGQRSDGQPLKPGSLVFLQGNQDKIHHVGVYIGDNTCVEAKGTQSGVVTSPLSRWDHWGECKLIDYSDASAGITSSDAIRKAAVEPVAAKPGTVRAEAVNPNTWLNVRSGPSTGSKLVCQIERGTIVDIVAQDGGWMQIRTGGRIGWVSAEYLKVLEPEGDQEEVPEEYEEPEAMPESYTSEQDALLLALSGIRDQLDTLISQLGGSVG